MEKVSKAKIQGFEVNLLSFQQALNFATSIIDNGETIQVVTINPEMIIKASKDEELALAIKNAGLVVPDGVGVKIALKIKGIKQEQVRGISFAHKMLERANAYGWKVAFLGAKQEVLDKTIENLSQDFENLNIVFKQNGYFTNEEEVINNIKKASPQLLLCALGTPKQEVLNAKLKDILPNCVLIGVGGSFDVWSGCTEGAPLIWQKMGLEWLYRTIKQPDRLNRILPTLPLFLFRAIIDKYKKE